MSCDTNLASRTATLASLSLTHSTKPPSVSPATKLISRGVSLTSKTPARSSRGWLTQAASPVPQSAAPSVAAVHWLGRRSSSHQPHFQICRTPLTGRSSTVRATGATVAESTTAASTAWPGARTRHVFLRRSKRRWAVLMKVAVAIELYITKSRHQTCHVICNVTHFQTHVWIETTTKSHVTRLL